jgi:flagellar operon protein
MNERISIGQLYPTTIPLGRKPNQAPSNPQTVRHDGKSFQDYLQSQTVRFSHHAELRLQQRGIQFRPEQMAKLDSAVAHLAEKGARDSLIVMNDTALIVSIKNKTVVTAMDGSAMKDNVFTQIDSAFIIS